MRLFKKHKLYPESMSVEITLFKTNKNRYTVQEYIDPHYLCFRKWTECEDSSLAVLTKWYHLPLNKRSREIHKQAKQLDIKEE